MADRTDEDATRAAKRDEWERRFGNRWRESLRGLKLFSTFAFLSIYQLFIKGPPSPDTCAQRTAKDGRSLMSRARTIFSLSLLGHISLRNEWRRLKNHK